MSRIDSCIWNGICSVLLWHKYYLVLINPICYLCMPVIYIVLEFCCDDGPIVVLYRDLPISATLIEQQYKCPFKDKNKIGAGMEHPALQACPAIKQDCDKKKAPFCDNQIFGSRDLLCTQSVSIGPWCRYFLRFITF